MDNENIYDDDDDDNDNVVRMPAPTLLFSKQKSRNSAHHDHEVQRIQTLRVQMLNNTNIIPRKRLHPVMLNNNNNTNNNINQPPLKRIKFLNIDYNLNNNNNNNNFNNTSILNNENEETKQTTIELAYNQQINNNNKYIPPVDRDKSLRSILGPYLETLFTEKGRNGINWNQIFREPEMILLAEALTPQLNRLPLNLPVTIPPFPVFPNNQYHQLNKDDNIHNYTNKVDLTTPSPPPQHLHQIFNSNSNNRNRTRNINRNSPIISEKQKQKQTIEYPSEIEWNKLVNSSSHVLLLQKWRDIYEKWFNNFEINYKLMNNYCVSASPSQIGCSLRILCESIFALLRDTNVDINHNLYKYYLALLIDINRWNKYIEHNNIDNHLINYDIKYLLYVGESYLLLGILAQKLNNLSSSFAINYYKQCLIRIRIVHKYIKLRNNININDIGSFHIEAYDADYNNKYTRGFNRNKITKHNLIGEINRWRWLHYDLNVRGKNDNHIIDFIDEIGPYQYIIIEAYNRLSFIHKYSSSQQKNALARALRILRNNNQTITVIGVKLLIDYANTNLSADPLFYFYLMNLSFGILNISPNLFSSQQKLDFYGRFFIQCISVQLSSQENYRKLMKVFIKNSFVTGTGNGSSFGAQNVARLLRIAYISMYYGRINESHFLYRAARSLLQYTAYDQEIKIASNKYKLSSNSNKISSLYIYNDFEVFWCFKHYLHLSISVLCEHSMTTYDSSYIKHLYDYIEFKNYSSTRINQITSEIDNKYYGFQMIDTRMESLDSARALVLGLFYSNNEFYPDQTYLGSIRVLLEFMKPTNQWKTAYILGIFVEESFPQFQWKKNQSKNNINIENTKETAVIIE